MRLRQRALAVLAFAIVILGASAAVAAPAQASQSDCLSGRYCVWVNQNWEGTPTYYWTISSGSGGFCVNYGAGLNDKVDSVKIRGGRSATQYRHANCSGSTISIVVSDLYGGPSAAKCGAVASWNCFWEANASYLPSSAWIIR